jgi:UDP-N-acetylmuramoyl-tripeptide--D-alanyl-D-alanine ligase
MSVETACQITNGSLVNTHCRKRRFGGVSVDTRTIKSGNAFFCLRGNTDGHRFAGAAGDRNAGVIFADRGHARRWAKWDVPVIGVDDPLTALGDLAQEFRHSFPTRYVAVTGSVGKTTTKELIAGALAQRYSVFKSPGNYNNLIGIPLALLSRNPKSKSPELLGVLELGMSTPGEIARLTEIVDPSWGVVTRIAPSHMQQMKSLAAIARAKRELFDNASPEAIAFLNHDDPWQRKWMVRWKRTTVTYGLTAFAGYGADQIEVDRRARASFRVNGRYQMALSIPGEHNVANAVAAIAVARHLGVSFDQIALGLKRVRPVGQRSRIDRINGISLIEDCYNANPASTEAALHTLHSLRVDGRRIAVLGAMRELGPREREYHRQVGVTAAATAEILVTVGTLAREYARGASAAKRRIHTMHCADRNAAIAELKQILKPGDALLLKASHSEKFEEIAESVRNWIAASRGRRRD